MRTPLLSPRRSALPGTRHRWSLRLAARCPLLLLLTGLVTSGAAAVLDVDLHDLPLGEHPRGFRSAVTGEGSPGDWRVLFETATNAPATDLPTSTVASGRNVIAQLARDPTPEHYPLLILEGEKFGDFTASVRFKIVAGDAEQMAGLAFRIQDERNYYVARASALGGNLLFYKMVDGVPQPNSFVGTRVTIPTNTWLALAVECRGNRIRALLNDQQVLPPVAKDAGDAPPPTLVDDTFQTGWIGLWTKSDSVSQFRDLSVNYQSQERLAAQLVRQGLLDNPRLLGLKIYAPTNSGGGVHIVASDDPAEIGRPASPNESDTVRHGTPYYGREKSHVSVLLPLHDRNGEPIAAVRVVLRKYLGQTDNNALARARPIVQQMQKRVRSLKDLLE